jgi:hypothetical protein
VLRLAKVFGDVFYPLNFSFTDIVAAITLVGITHRTRAHRPGGVSHSHALIAAAGAGLFGHGKQQGYEHVLAILQTAEAAALVGSGAAAGGSIQGIGESPAPTAAVAAGCRSQANGNAVGLCLAGQQQQEAAAAAAAAGMPKSKSHQQLLKLLLDLEHDREEILGQQDAAEASAASSAAGSQTHGQSNKFDHTSGPGASLASILKLPKPATANSLTNGLRRASSDGAVPGRHSSSSSMTAELLPAAAAAGSAFGSSIWEQAVRQASALAVAPGYGLNPGSRQGSSSALNLKGSSSPNHQAAATGSSSRQRSQGAEPQANPECVPASRAQSWAGAVSHDGRGSGLETLVSGVATATNSLVSSHAGSGPGSNRQGPGLQGADVSGAQPDATSRGVQGSSSSSSRLGRQQQQQQQEQHSPLKPHMPPQQLAAGNSKSSTSSYSIPQSCGRPPLHAPGVQRASSAAAAAAEEVRAAADTVVAELQAAAAVADAAAAAGGGGAAATSKMAAAVEAAEAAVGVAVLSDGSNVSLELLEEALHWHRYGMCFLKSIP